MGKSFNHRQVQRDVIADHTNPAYVKAYRAKLEQQSEEEARKTKLKPWMFN